MNEPITLLHKLRNFTENKRKRRRRRKWWFMVAAE